MSNDEITVLPDGSAFATASWPLPKTHWLFRDNGFEAPPMVMRMGTDNPDRREMAAKIREAGRYALRASTMNGKSPDWDPDAVIQNLVVAFLGYFTPDGLDHADEWMNPGGLR